MYQTPLANNNKKNTQGRRRRRPVASAEPHPSDYYYFTTHHDYYNDDDDDSPPNNKSNNNTKPAPDETAAHFARQVNVTQAGYLAKLDNQHQQQQQQQQQNHQPAPLWKRRFFVLQPATHLYYFLSPTDTEPRGCLALDEAVVTLGTPLPDGRTRVSLEWPQHEEAQSHADYYHNNDYIHNDDAHDDNQQHAQRRRRQVILEARSAESAQEWYDALTQQRYGYLRQQHQTTTVKLQVAHERITRLETQLQQARWLETDVQQARAEAAQWQAQYTALEEGVRRLTRMVTSQNNSTTRTITTTSMADVSWAPTPATRKLDPSETTKNANDDDDKEAAMGDQHRDEDKESHKQKDNQRDCDKGTVTEDNIPLEPQQSGQTSREASLLDNTMGEEEGEEEQEDKKRSNVHPDDKIEHDTSLWDVSQVPGRYFGGLHNACLQLQENVRLAGLEAQTAVQDVLAAQQEVQRLQKRGKEAEAQLMQMWEENCTLRKALKHKKREKRVLVREVKSLQTKLQQVSESTPPNRATESSDDEPDEDEEKLINELEEHVMSSIRLHEQIMASTPGAANASFTSSTQRQRPASPLAARTPLFTKRSLFDDVDEDSSEDDDSFGEAEEDKKLVGKHHKDNGMSVPKSALSNYAKASPDPLPTEAESVSSVQAEASINGQTSTCSSSVEKSPVRQLSMDENGSRDRNQDVAASVVSTSSTSSFPPDETPVRPHPIQQLDALEKTPIAADATSEPYQPTLLSGRATASLACSLTSARDRMMQRQEGIPSDSTDDLQVYHLTFYSRKIGIQFQKVPPPPTKPKGLLTDAVKADLVDSSIPQASERTAAELRMIANLSNHAKIEAGDENKDDVTSLRAATPVDAVLVCGFHGFDESGANVRPKLGARLVAFDGVSVEVGRWTFDSIRKAILSRSRPLTLSFRNDYLTVEQREILTRAVQEANHSARRLSVTAAETSSELPSSLAQSVHSATSHESGAFVNENVVVNVKHSGDRSGFAETDSVSVMTERSMGPETPLPMTLSERKRTPYSFRSFSDVGSSTSSVLSAVGPLMAHLLPPTRPVEPFTPDYMAGKGQSVEETPEHQDFASSLL